MCYHAHAHYRGCGHSPAAEDREKCAFAKAHPDVSHCPYYKKYFPYKIEGFCPPCGDVVYKRYEQRTDEDKREAEDEDKERESSGGSGRADDVEKWMLDVE